MVAAGIHVVPPIAPADLVVLAREAEAIGYEYFFLADEGFEVDVYACLALVAAETSTIRLGAMTNGYTRHPAVTAAALATLNTVSGGRALVTMLAGGSMVLSPMGIPRERPYLVVSETIHVMRSLWNGEPVTWSGSVFSLDAAQLGLGPQQIPVWLACRGPMMLDLAGRSADGLILTVKPDLGGAIQIADTSASSTGRAAPSKTYLGRICYQPEMLADQRRTLPFVLMDSPPRVLGSLGLHDDQISLVTEAASTNRPGLISHLVTDDLLRRYQVAGTPAECAGQLATLADTHDLDNVLVDVLSPDLGENLRLINETYQITTGAVGTATGDQR